MRKILKWLRPGLRIKRWIFIIFLGVMCAFIGSWAIFTYVNTVPHSANDWGRGFIAAALFSFTLSGFFLITGIYRLIKSMWELADQRGMVKGIAERAYERHVLSRGPKVVTIGGGTGLSVVLTGMKNFSHDITAIVSMADDGGSSGKLRNELGIQPPGDIRKCLIALADEEPLMAELLEYRFQEHELSGHSFGNLFLTALARLRGDFGEAVREANRILSVRGRVLPSTLENVFLVATHEDGTKTTGQALICNAEKRIKRLELKPNPESIASDIVEAVREADLIVLGPGSLYTSVLPNLLIGGLTDALTRSQAVKVFVVNALTYEGETKGYSVADILQAVDQHTYPHRVYSHVLINNGNPGPEGEKVIAAKNARPIACDPQHYANAPFHMVFDDIINPAYPIRHDSVKLARALMDILKGV
jgi:uncharacterized cofD-like protein